MKQKLLLFFALLTLISCQNEEMKSKNAETVSLAAFQNKWIQAETDANTARFNGFVTCYMFPKNDVLHLMETPQLKRIRFVLGVTNGKLDVITQGVNSRGTSLGMISSTVVSNRHISNQINQLATSRLRFSCNDAILRRHLLNPAQAYNYVNRWNMKLAENADLNDVISYDNVRINYFSIDKEIVQEIADLSDFKYLGVLLGVNPEGKLTTVLLGLDINRDFIILSQTNKGGGANVPPTIFDFSQPCPNTCK
jgi:hypothetical protein